MKIFERVVEEILERPRIKTALQGKEIEKIIYVPRKVINIVTRNGSIGDVCENGGH